jgi:hypothetical protein
MLRHSIDGGTSVDDQVPLLRAIHVWLIRNIFGGSYDFIFQPFDIGQFAFRVVFSEIELTS